MNSGYEIKTIRQKGHQVSLDNRESAAFTGVTDVESFNEEQVVLLTETGAVILSGKGLHIVRLDLDQGILAVEGYVYALEYDDSDAMGKKKGLISRLFS
ncbi:MAG: sporulation protein YabP [Clostridiales bacterium]|nr:sporulation protein YabP [Clostridiales bacterium]MBQ2817210.1 sporulation protein YabP [Clostridia bacterium]MBQ4638207.1 sporulation protein YabP [Clostridia bacterium]